MSRAGTSDGVPRSTDGVPVRRHLWRFALLWVALLAVAAGVGAATGRDGRDGLLLFAATTLGLMGVAHSFLGERFILRRLFARGDLPRVLGSRAFTRRTLRFAWHLNSAAWWGIATLVLAARVGADPRQLLRVVAVAAAASALVTAVGSRFQHPAYAAFAAVGVAVWVGAGA